MHRYLFRHQKALEQEDLERYAAELGLDVARFKQDMHDHIHEPRIQRDVRSGRESGVQGIPTLFINGVRYEGAMKLATILETIENGSEQNPHSK